MHQFKTYLPVLLWFLLITVLSLTPAVQLPSVPFLTSDKLAHAFFYGVFAWLMLRGYRRSAKNGWNLPTAACVFCALSSIYGALMEVFQYVFIPGRYFELGDMLANTFGAIVGVLLYALLQRKRFLATQGIL